MFEVSGGVDQWMGQGASSVVESIKQFAHLQNVGESFCHPPLGLVSSPQAENERIPYITSAPRTDDGDNCTRIQLLG